MVFKDYERGIKTDLIQCEIALAHSLATVTVAEIFAGLSGNSTVQDRADMLLKRLPHITQVAKHVIAPWWCPPPSDEKDRQEDKGMVDWYNNLKTSIDVIKKKRREEREREEAMSKKEQKEHALDKLIESSEYRTK